jgi:hypothetical protein
MCLKLYRTIGVPLLELIVRNIVRYSQSAASTSIRYQLTIRYLVPWYTVGVVPIGIEISRAAAPVRADVARRRSSTSIFSDHETRDTDVS